MKFTLTMFALFPLIALILFTAGCGPAPPPPPITEGGYEVEHPNVLPKGADVIEDYGNGWVLFKLEVFGEDRYFLIRNEGDRSGDGQWATESMTEVAPPKQ